MRIGIVLITLLLVLPLQAAEMERVLLPITVLDVPGAHGSVWRSELWAHIRTTGVAIFPIRIADAQPFPPGTQIVPIFLHQAGQAPGQFIHVTSHLLERVSFNLRVRDLSRLHETWGTEIPVVRERDFLREPISLLPLPIEPGFRNTIRVYAADQSGGNVLVRVTLIDPQKGARIVHESTRHLPAAASHFQPPYFELALETLVSSSDRQVARVDVEPLGGIRIWAFASTTQNETQHVTTTSPQ